MRMLKKDGYYKKTVKFSCGIQIVTKCKMPTLGKGGKREPKTQPSTERQEKKNLNKSIEKLHHLLLANFHPGDFNLVLTHTDKTGYDREAAKKTVQKFIAMYTAYCTKHGYKADYIYNTEQHKDGRLHHHIVLHNHGDLPQIKLLWEKQAGGGLVVHKPRNYMLWADYDWYGLAAYFCGVKEDGTVIYRHPKGERRYIPSHGLKKPEITYEWIDANRWYKPRAPKGWYVVPETIRSSMDEETGGGFIKYLMKRVD